MAEFTTDLIEAAEESGARRLIINGSMTIQHGQELKAALEQAMEGGRGVILDLTKVTDADLSGLQCICAAHRTAIDRLQSFSVSREGNQVVDGMVSAAGFTRHAGCAGNAGHTCVWAGEGE